MQRKQFEYKRRTATSDIDEVLNEEGLKGWEAFSVVTCGGKLNETSLTYITYYRIYFKREIINCSNES